MKSLFSPSSITLAVLLLANLTSTSRADVIAFDDFDTSQNMTLRIGDPALNTDSRFGIYNRTTLGSPDMYDQTVGNPFDPGNPDPLDDRGIIRSTKTDSFFGEDDDGVVNWLFNISGANELTNIQIDMAAMGDYAFEGKSFAYSIDNEIFTTFATLQSTPVLQAYPMENGLSYDIFRPLTLNNGPLLSNQLTTYTFDGLAGRSGSVLAIRFTTNNGGGGGTGGNPFVFDNLQINGVSAVPEPSGGFALLGMATLLGCRRRRKNRLLCCIE